MAALRVERARPRREAWAALRREGLLPREIAELEGVTSFVVSEALYRARRVGIDAPHAPTGAAAHRRAAA